MLKNMARPVLLRAMLMLAYSCEEAGLVGITGLQQHHEARTCGVYLFGSISGRVVAPVHLNVIET